MDADVPQRAQVGGLTATVLPHETKKARSRDRAFVFRGREDQRVKLKLAACVVPSANFSCSWRQLPAQALSDFHT